MLKDDLSDTFSGTHCSAATETSRCSIERGCVNRITFSNLVFIMESGNFDRKLTSVKNRRKKFVINTGS